MAEAFTLDLTAFDPSPERARAVGAHMRERLADSIRYILEQVEGHLSVPQMGIERFLKRLSLGPVPPLVFGTYCDLVLAIDAGAHDEAERLLREIAVAPNAQLGLRVTELGDPETDTQANRYRRLVDTDTDMPFTIWQPPVDGALKARSLIDQALQLLDRGNPALAGEIRNIVSEIVLAAASDAPGAVQFDGVSSFMLWGAVVLNVGSYATVLDMVQALAHESGHNLLFALCADGPLHENGESERFSSPLRIDPRPMDGIFHATYVSARMHQSVQRLLDIAVLSDAERAEAWTANAANAKRFAMGLVTVDRHARLTPLGRAVRDDAERYMAPYL